MALKTRKLTISLDPWTFDLLAALAAHDDRSLSYVVGTCIQREATRQDGRGLAPEVLEALEKKYPVDSSKERLAAVVGE